MMSGMILMRKVLIASALCFSVYTNAYSQDNQLTDKEKKEGWQILFDGKSMNQWRKPNSDSFPSRGWIVENGVLFIDGNNGRQSGGDIITKEQFDDFEFTTDFKLTEGANSGIKYSVHIFNPPVRGLGSVLGPEYQVLDDEKHPDAKAGRDGNRKQGSLYDILPSKTANALRPIGEWNTARIVSKGNHVEHWLNGVKVLEYDKTSDAYKTAFSLSKFKDVTGYGESAKGHLLLQDHGDKVFFRNIKIRKL
jgi:hypothetical protein